MKRLIEPSRGRRHLALRIAVELATITLIAVAAWFLWPASLGGGTQMIAVQGTSMQPTYRTGDMLVVRENETPEIGDILVFRIPADEPGGGNLVVHRAIGRRDDGSIVTQGDNRDTPDPFHVTEREIVGTPVFVIPFAARAVGLLSTPFGLALIGGALFTLLVWPDQSKRRNDTSDDEADPTLWRVPEIEEFMADAEAWVERELADLLGDEELHTEPQLAERVEDDEPAEAWVERELAALLASAGAR